MKQTQQICFITYKNQSNHDLTNHSLTCFSQKSIYYAKCFLDIAGGVISDATHLALPLFLPVLFGNCAHAKSPSQNPSEFEQTVFFGRDTFKCR